MARIGDDFERGRKVGKYEIVTRLSMGGMAELYLAVLRGAGGFKKFVALKMILPDVRRDDVFIKMFLDEARLTAALAHPNIGQVFELGNEPGTGELYLAMEFIAGQTLAEVIKRAQKAGRPLPPEFSCRVVRDMCLALQSAHGFIDPAKGVVLPIIHRDVSPSNVMVTYNGTVKVIDFGIAKAKNRLVRTKVGMVKGTAGYMSPEQAIDGELDARSDVFSAGVVLYELLSGKPLFGSAIRETEQMERIVREDVRPLREVAPDVPPALSDVVMHALARDPAARCPSARELARSLESVCPRLFDEEQLAAVMRELFPDTIALTRELLDSANADAADAGALIETAEKLSRATGERARSERGQETTAPIARALPESPAPAEERSSRGSAVALVIGGLLAAGALGGWWYFMQEEAPVPAGNPAMLELEAQVIPQARAAIAQRDLTRAKQILEGCRVGMQPCPAAVPLLAEVDEKRRADAAARADAGEVLVAKELPAPGVCELDAASQSIRQLELGHATMLLRNCTTPSGLDKRAATMLKALEKERGDGESLLKARAALDEGNLSDAKRHLDTVFRPNLFRPAKEDLQRRYAQLVLERSGGVGPRGKVLSVAAPAVTEASSVDSTFTIGADMLLKNGKVSEAVQMLNTCVERNPRSAGCQFRLGTAHARAGDASASYRAYKRFLEIAAPGDPNVPKAKSIVVGYERQFPE